MDEEGGDRGGRIDGSGDARNAREGGDKARKMKAVSFSLSLSLLYSPLSISFYGSPTLEKSDAKRLVFVGLPRLQSV